jgi:tetratricopeptide (TPR) repeat protein
MRQGDTHEAKLETRAALECYLAVEKTEPENPTVLLKIARQYRHLMSDEPSEANKIKWGKQALGYAQRAARLGPRDSEAVLSPAITYGKMVKYLSKKEQVAASTIIKAGAEKSASLNPKNDLAWHVLGRWHRVASDVGTVKRALAGMLYDKLPPSSLEESAKYLEVASKLNPTRVMHQIELGKTYAQMGRSEDARRVINKGLALPSREKDDAAEKRAGREVLATLR